MTPGEALDSALRRLGTRATVRGRDFSITGAVSRVDGAGVTLMVAAPMRSGLPTSRAGSYEFSVPFTMVAAIEDAPSRERRLRSDAA